MTTVLSPDAALLRLPRTAGEVMTGQVVVLAGDTPADVAVRRLEQAKESGAPVTEHGRVVGVVTLRDLLAPLASSASNIQMTGPFLRFEHHLAGYRVRDLMSREPVTARTDWPLGRVVLLMQETGVNRIPVVNRAGEAVGILTRDDVLHALARLLHGHVTRPAHGSLMEPD